MQQLRSNVKFIVWLGFGAIIALMLTISLTMFYKLNQQATQFNNVVTINNIKVSLVHVMRDAINSRALTLNKMALSDDIFFRDEERLKFGSFARSFIRAFNDFKKFKFNESEVRLNETIQKRVIIGYAATEEALDMLLNNDEINTIKPVLVSALLTQENVLTTLDELIALQKTYAEKSVKATEKNMDEMLTLLVIVVFVSILFSIFVSQAVSRIVSAKNKELAQATETKSMFLANMSHEIRTPLTAIIGFAKSQMIPNLPADHNERATKIILRNSEHLLTVINDILDLTKIEAQKLEYEYTDFSLFNLLDDVHSSLTGLIGEKAIKFTVNYSYPIPDIIRTDKIRLRQVLVNLGGNAIKFTEAGFINVNIRYDRVEHDVYFDISDSGIGMTAKQQEVVFQTFTQGDITTTRKYGGTGLGITISNELVSKLGGDLTVVSEHGVGSTFSFKITNCVNELELPLLLVNQAPSNIQRDDDLFNHVTDHLVQGTILLVEDIPDNQELISFRLSQMGAIVTTVDNGKQAVDITTTSFFDLVLMDMQMPVMGALEAVKIIRERGSKLPIVMLTANAGKEHKEESIRAGCDGFLPKPLNEHELFEVVKKYLRVIKPDNASLKNDTSEIANDSLIGSGNDVIVSTLMTDIPNEYEQFVRKFVNHLPKYVDEISEYINVKNDAQLKAITHKLKGVGGNMGFKVLTDISANFEIAIKQDNRDEIGRLFNELKLAAKKIYRGNEVATKDKLA